jgi:tetratricopeptide (TPR) repeat protein
MFSGRWEEAFGLLPEDERFQHLRRLYQAGPRYREALLKIYWNNPEALNAQAAAMTFGPGGGLETRKSTYERVLELDPENSKATRELGAICLSLDDLGRAENLLRKAVRLNPDLGAPHYNLGLLLYNAGRRTEALQQWQTAAMLGDAMAVEQLGAAMISQARIAEAVLCFNHALELSPTQTSARLRLAALLYQTGRGQEALPHVRYILKMDPEDKTALSLLSKIQGKTDADAGP